VDTKKLQTELDRLLTVQELKKGFGNVAAVTIHTWRNRKELPHLVVRGAARDSIRFYLPDVQKWAKQSGRKLNLKVLQKKKGRGNGRRAVRTGTTSQPQQKAA
jgi:hypothetical protein